jgi:protein O-mannosyl-transferase
VALVLYDRCFPTGGRKNSLRDKIPFVLAAAVVAFLALQSQAPEDSGWGAEGGGRATGFHGGSFLATLFTMLPVLCRYLRMLVWPAGLSADYDPAIHTSPGPMVIASAGALAIIGLLCYRLFRHDRRLGFWTFFFFLGLLPVSQVVPLVTLMNDRYLYFPLLGFSALAGAGAVFLRERVGARYPMAFHVLIALVLGLLSLVSFQRTALWKDAVTLWNDAVTVSPGKSLTWERLGEAYHFSRPPRPDEALKAYRQALELDPSNRFTLYNLGLLYTTLGDYDNAHAMLNRLLTVSPDHVMGLAALGNLYRYREQYDEAEKVYGRAHALQPDAMEVVVSLGELALIRGQLDLARHYYEIVEGKGGGDPEIAYDLACVEALAGRVDLALSWLEKALQRGFHDHGRVYDNRELAALWDDPRYGELLQRFARQLQ